MFSLIRSRAGNSFRPLVSRPLAQALKHAPPALIFQRSFFKPIELDEHNRAKPTARQISLARKLVEAGAPDAEALHRNMSASEMSDWISKAMETTTVAPTTNQLTLAEKLIEAGAPHAEEVHENMTYKEMSEWLAKVQQISNFTVTKFIPSGTTRNLPATANQLALAEKLATSSSIPIPYSESVVKRGEVSDFILHCKEVLAAKGLPTHLPTPEERDMPPTEGQRTKALRLGIEIPAQCTRGELSDLITEKQKELGASERVTTL